VRLPSIDLCEGVAAAETLVMPVVGKVEEELIDLLAASA
jgi:hypothetical protein